MGIWEGRKRMGRRRSVVDWWTGGLVDWWSVATVGVWEKENAPENVAAMGRGSVGSVGSVWLLYSRWR
jgi:hypothetical protein